jgi:minimal PKS acyl carrier protein
MGRREVTFEDLKRILRESAGTDENVDLDGDVLDTDFADLGYDSLALLETAGRIAVEYGITVDDDVATGARTPRGLLEVVNGG